MSQLDFQYDPKDISLVRSTFLSLKEDEGKGFKAGLLSGIISYGVSSYLLRLRNRNSIFLGALGLLVGYSSYTHKSKVDYQNVARECNLKVSREINSRIRAVDTI